MLKRPSWLKRVGFRTLSQRTLSQSQRPPPPMAMVTSRRGPDFIDPLIRDAKLSEKGISQATELRRLVHHIQPDAVHSPLHALTPAPKIVVSPLRRAIQTALIAISDSSCHPPPPPSPQQPKQALRQRRRPPRRARPQQPRLGLAQSRPAGPPPALRADDPQAEFPTIAAALEVVPDDGWWFGGVGQRVDDIAVEPKGRELKDGRWCADGADLEERIAAATAAIMRLPFERVLVVGHSCFFRHLAPGLYAKNAEAFLVRLRDDGAVLGAEPVVAPL
jgi:broad specificity phosphatase PhoE